ncbi:MAG: hypothetical protein J0L79_06245 [Rickettsiales bacterium]|nr:hypothetical protein [Rickettsiales bacterium]MCA0254412.1 hypothetical protein [Pseudomonadota bacterium]
MFNKQANIIGLAHVDFNRTVESIVRFVSQIRYSEEEPLELVLKGARWNPTKIIMRYQL